MARRPPAGGIFPFLLSLLWGVTISGSCQRMVWRLRKAPGRRWGKRRDPEFHWAGFLNGVLGGAPGARGGQESCCLSKWAREGWGTEIQRWAPEPGSAEVTSRGGAGTQGTLQLRE